MLAATPRVPCAQEPQKFFGDTQDEDEPYDDEHMQEAIALCQECPIKIECLIQALQNNETHGVWGGMTPAQRESTRNRI